jgi:Heterokaryon incompatibility protein (HET)
LHYLHIPPTFLLTDCHNKQIEDLVPNDKGTNPLNDTSITFLTFKNWLRICDKKHHNCRNRSYILPTRLIDVDLSGAHKPHLLPSSSIIQPSDVQYIALSHCWGPSGTPFKTTKQNIRSHMEKISECNLPKTFADAIAIARGVSVQCLWIDSICIVQDDITDWSQESASMATIYRNAYFTIAATASKNGHGGCFRSGGSWVSAEFYVGKRNGSSVPKSDLLSSQQGAVDAVVKPIPNIRKLIENSPLNKRAWVFQEMVLSRRVIHFTESQPIWLCQERMSSEDGLIEQAIRINHHLTAALAPPFGVDSTTSSTWWTLVTNFTARSITNQQDRPAAIAGIIEFFQRLTGDESIVGLWKSTLFTDLLWRPTSRRGGVKPSDLPTWSWISCGEVIQAIPDCGKWENSRNLGQPWNMGTAIDARITWSGPAMTSRLLSATLTVKGPISRAIIEAEPPGSYHTFYEEEEDDFEIRPYRRKMRSVDMDRTCQGWCIFDSAPPVPETTVYCLAMRRLIDLCSFKYVFQALVLEPVDNLYYRRLGIAAIEESFPSLGRQDFFQGVGLQSIDLV